MKPSGLYRRCIATAAATLAAAGLGGCFTTGITPEQGAQVVIHRVEAPPDTVFAAARQYYARLEYRVVTLDTDSRLMSVAYHRFGGSECKEVVWVRPAPDGGSTVRIKAVWGAGYADYHRPAAIAAELTKATEASQAGDRR